MFVVVHLVVVAKLGSRGTYRSNWRGPVKGCPIPERHKASECPQCASAQARVFRKNHPLSKLQRFKDTARSYAGVYLRRGKIVKGPCVDCGSEESQMHHEDYGKPTEVLWLCRSCHLNRHKVLVDCGIVPTDIGPAKERTSEQRSLDTKPRWGGPLPGCPNQEPHPWRKCRQCRTADMRRRRSDAGSGRAETAG